MTFFHALLLGIVEGVTEFLPISSTGHLILVSHLLGILDSDVVKSFEIIIQLGAIFAVLILYFKKVLQAPRLWLTLFVGFLPTAVLGLVCYSFIKKYLLGNVAVVLWALLLGGVGLILFEFLKKEDGPVELDAVSFSDAVVIGFAQVVAFIPGVSRSAATIIAGRARGLSRRTAVEFSFLLSIPTMVAASALDILKHPVLVRANLGLLIFGFSVSCVVALLSIMTFLRFVKTHTLIPFGIYRIILAVTMFFVFFI